MTSTVRTILGILVALCSGLVLLPIGIGLIRNSPRMASITLWNTLGLCLFGIGWIVALVQSLTDAPGASNQGAQTVVVNNIINNASPAKDKAE